LVDIVINGDVCPHFKIMHHLFEMHHLDKLHWRVNQSSLVQWCCQAYWECDLLKDAIELNQVFG
jgi:hypothetical protein